jgi:hypothetical protein
VLQAVPGVEESLHFPTHRVGDDQGPSIFKAVVDRVTRIALFRKSRHFYPNALVSNGSLVMCILLRVMSER